jgi:ABC-2 type transport system ATP-binding protein
MFEGHLAYEFMSIEGIERFFAPFYPRVALGALLRTHRAAGSAQESHKIGNMSEGQRSQVVLGLIMAQQPEVMILDDYTMGLDAGYRRLFLEYYWPNTWLRAAKTVLGHLPHCAGPGAVRG